MNHAEKKYAVIDPHWGDPKVVVATISDTPEAAIEKALLSEDCALYSGASLAQVPPNPGCWEVLTSYGYTCSPISITIGHAVADP